MDVKEALSRDWFHAIDFGDGIVSPGRFGRDVPPNYTLFGVLDLLPYIDLSKARCLDVGTMDGLIAFVLKGMGADEVVACDLCRRDTFEWARDQLGLDVDYRVPVNALDLPSVVGDVGADVVVLAGVLYHVYDPLTVLVASRKSLREGGLLFVEALCMPDEGRPVMWFNPSDDTRRQLPMEHVYWRASKTAVHGMMRLAGFEILATRMVRSRLTVLGEARRPRDISSRDRLIALAQDKGRHAHYQEAADFDALAAGGDRAKVRYEGPRDDRFLYRALFEPRVPFQPAWDPPSLTARVRQAARDLTSHGVMRFAERSASLASGIGRRFRRR